jgi:hypothetical protein
MHGSRPPSSVARRVIRSGNEEIELRDSAASPVYVDAIVESGAANGTILLSMGAIVRDSQCDPFVDITCRMRMNPATALSLHAFLGKVLEDLKKHEDQRASASGQATQPNRPTPSKQKRTN